MIYMSGFGFDKGCRGEEGVGGGMAFRTIHIHGQIGLRRKKDEAENNILTMAHL